MKRDMEHEAEVINEAAISMAQTFKAEGRKVETIVVVVLFEASNPAEYDFHVAQVGADDNEEQAQELMCECVEVLKNNVGHKHQHPQAKHEHRGEN